MEGYLVAMSDGDSNANTAYKCVIARTPEFVSVLLDAHNALKAAPKLGQAQMELPVDCVWFLGSSDADRLFPDSEYDDLVDIVIPDDLPATHGPDGTTLRYVNLYLFDSGSFYVAGEAGRNDWHESTAELQDTDVFAVAGVEVDHPGIATPSDSIVLWNLTRAEVDQYGGQSLSLERVKEYMLNALIENGFWDILESTVEALLKQPMETLTDLTGQHIDVEITNEQFNMLRDKGIICDTVDGATIADGHTWGEAMVALGWWFE